jgi:hypothetical protein
MPSLSPGGVRICRRTGQQAGITWLTVVMAVLAVMAIVDIALAVRRRSRTAPNTTTEAG